MLADLNVTNPVSTNRGGRGAAHPSGPEWMGTILLINIGLLNTSVLAENFASLIWDKCKWFRGALSSDQLMHSNVRPIQWACTLFFRISVCAVCASNLWRLRDIWSDLGASRTLLDVGEANRYASHQSGLQAPYFNDWQETDSR